MLRLLPSRYFHAPKAGEVIVFLPADVAPIYSNVAGRPRGSGQGPARSTQQAGTLAAIAARIAAGREAADTETAAAAAAGDEAEDGDEVGDATPWGRRGENQQSAWQDCCSTNRGLYYDSLPCNLARSKFKTVGTSELTDEVHASWSPPCVDGEYLPHDSHEPPPGLVKLHNVRLEHMLRLIGKSPPLPVTSAPSPSLMSLARIARMPCPFPS
jgi:hypothetical protein